MKTIVRILSRITLLAVAGIILSLLYKADANAGTLTVFADPEASGTITVNDEVLPYPDGSAEIGANVPVTIVATTDEGHSFTYWSVTDFTYTGDTTDKELNLKHIKHSEEIKNYLLKTSEEARIKRRTVNMLDIGSGDLNDVNDIGIE